MFSWWNYHESEYTIILAGEGEEREVALVTEAIAGAETEAGQGVTDEGVEAEVDQGDPIDAEGIVAEGKKEAAVVATVGVTRKTVTRMRYDGYKETGAEVFEEAAAVLHARGDTAKETRVGTTGVTGD